MATGKKRPLPSLHPEYCKGCERCISSCSHGCITPGAEIHPDTGLIPVKMNLDHCTACGLCMTACPEPYGIVPEEFEGLDRKESKEDFDLTPPETRFGPRRTQAPPPVGTPDTILDIEALDPFVIRGSYASVIGALLAGCRHFFGYPITPSTEGAELMAKLLPSLNGTFLQAISEVATVNMMYGCGGAGLRSMTFTSSPGFSLMLEGISYMIGAEVPGVIVNVMRGGPGLGNIAPEQADIKLACRGLGHGNTHAIVLAPSTPQEMLDQTLSAFDLTMKYRSPVIILCDGFLGQMTGKVGLPRQMVKPGIPAWAVYGDRLHRANLITSIHLDEADLEEHNRHLNRKYEQIRAREQQADLYCCEDAETLVVACNTPSRMAKGAVREMRQQGVAVGLFRPLTLWPFPIRFLKPLLKKASRILIVESSPGQLEDELRLALSHVGAEAVEISHVQHYGGILPQQSEIVEAIRALQPRRLRMSGTA